MASRRRPLGRTRRPMLLALLLLGGGGRGATSAAAILRSARWCPWVGPLANFYLDAKCANVGIHYVDLPTCQTLCAKDSSPPPFGCDAVNWGPDATGKTPGGCVLRACKSEAFKLHPDGPSVHDIHGYYCNGTRAECGGSPMPPGPSPPSPPWLGGSFGDARWEFSTTSASNSTIPAILTIPWRRRDQLPGPGHSAFLVTCSSGRRVDSALALARNRTSLTLAFSPTCGAGAYHLYFLVPGSSVPLPSPCGPHATCPSGMNGGCCSPGSNATLRGFEPGGSLNSATVSFRAAVQAGETTPAVLAPRAGPVHLPHSRNAFAEFTEMEAVASAGHVGTMLSRHRAHRSSDGGGGGGGSSDGNDSSDGGLLIFPEDATHEIRMLSYIPHRWAESGPRSSLALRAQRREYVSFQLGLFASEGAVENVRVRFEEDPTHQQLLTSAAAFKCITCGGVDHHGNSFTKTELGVVAGGVLPLWLGVMVPEDSAAQLQFRIHVSYDLVSTSASTAEVSPLPLSQTIAVAIDVATDSPPIADNGDQNMSKRTRLRWLDSIRAQDDAPAEPYTPIRVVIGRRDDDSVSLSILGRSLTVASSSCGLPTSIDSWGAELLASPIGLTLSGHGGWKPVAGGTTLNFTKTSSGIVSWQAECVTADGVFSLMTTCTLEAEGFLDVKLSVSATRANSTTIEEEDESTVLSNATLAIDFTNTNRTSRYSMGFGFLGSLLSPLEWRWDDLLPKRSSMIWVGGGTGGMRVSLKGAENHWDLPMWYGWPSRASGYDPTLAEVPRSWYAANHPCRSMFVSHHSLTLFF